MGSRKKSSTLADELHSPIRRKFKRRRVRVSGIDKIWAADLADMKAFSKDNRGVTYLLCVIDIFSKYGWLVPLKIKWVTPCFRITSYIRRKETRKDVGR